MLILLVVGLLSFFFCKQKTAYELRISDWSSDVCSSDLLAGSRHAPTPMGPGDEPRDDGGVCIAARLSGATGRGSASIIPHRCPQRAIELVDRHVVDHLFARGDQF